MTRQYGFFATMFGRARSAQRELIEEVSRALDANVRAAATLQRAIDERERATQRLQEQRRTAINRMAHKQRKGPKPI